MVQRKRGGDGVAVDQRNDTSNNSTTQEEMKNNENSKQIVNKQVYIWSSLGLRW